MTIPLQNKIIYGPVNSRRLGASLGINLLSSENKICNFNCVYCQYGWTTINKNELVNSNNFQNKNKVIESLEKALFALSPSPSYITFSGNGEATLHPDFDIIVDQVIQLRDKYAPNSKTAILSNSMGVNEEKTRRSISKLDIRIMKLDCGSDYLLKKYNRPLNNISIVQIIDGLKLIKDATIQTLFCAGTHGNSTTIDIDKWIEIVKEISPKNVQIYTLDRGYPSDKIFPLNIDKSIEIKETLIAEGIDAEVY